MKVIIKGKRYDTETAKYIGETGSWNQGIGPSDFNYWSETLYQKRTGEYFLFGEGGPMSKYSEPYENNGSQSGAKIIPLTLDKAKNWAEKAMDADEYESTFGPVEDDNGKQLVPLLVTQSVYNTIEQLSNDSNTTIAQIINNLIKNN